MPDRLSQEWPDHPKAGDVARTDPVGPIMVMGVIDGYYMLRRPGCAPFVEHWSDVREKRKPQPL